MTTDTSKPGLIYERIARMLEEVPAIGKDGRNKAQGFSFRSIDQVYDTLHPLLAKHHVFFTSHIMATRRDILDRIDKQSGKKIGHTVLTCLDVLFKLHCADDGSFIEVGPIQGEGADVADKASAKAQSLAMKYALLQLFCIPIRREADFVPPPEPPMVPINIPALKSPAGEEELARYESADKAIAELSKCRIVTPEAKTVIDDWYDKRAQEAREAQEATK